MMLKVVKHQVIAGQLIKLKVVNYSRLRPKRCPRFVPYLESLQDIHTYAEYY